MFHIKICGVKRPQDVETTAVNKGDAIGLNFFPPSVRYLDPDEPSTNELSSLAKSFGLLRVGVFVNESPKRIAEIVGTVGLDAIQLHGDEQVGDVKLIRSAIDSSRNAIPVIRAIKLPGGRIESSWIADSVDPWLEVGCILLFDADAGEAQGGSGNTFDWSSIRRWAELNGQTNWILAGGLTPENVADAIKASGATSVDTASGVEEPRGTKSVERIVEFIGECRRSLFR